MTVAELIPAWKKPVIRVPLNQAFPQMGELKEFKYKICLFSEDRSTLFDVVSPRYQLVEHAAGMELLDAAMQKRFGKTAPTPMIRTFNGGARMSAEYRLPLPQAKVAKGDVSEILIRVRNSYDRSCSFSANLAALRLVCTNGMTTTDNWGAMRLKHVGGEDDAEQRQMVEMRVAAQLEAMIENSSRLADTWKGWADRKVDLLTATRMIDGAFPRMYTDPILDEGRWKGERSFWDFYNDLTAMSSHQTRSAQRRQAFDDKIAAMFYGDSGIKVDGGFGMDDEDSED